MPYYNAAAYIYEAVKTIIAQTYKDWELIIIDDCSPAPETTAVLKQIEEMDSRIKVMRAEKNSGAGLARNIGIRMAQGQYIGFCDSDDWQYPTRLEEQLKSMQENGYKLTYTWYEDANEQLKPYCTVEQASRRSYKSMTAGCSVGTSGVLFDTGRVGKKYMPPLRRTEDWGLQMNILKDVDYIYTYPKALWKYRHAPGSETNNRWLMLKAVVKMYKTVLGMNPLEAWFAALFIFLPDSILEKLKRIV